MLFIVVQIMDQRMDVTLTFVFKQTSKGVTQIT